MNDLFDQLFLRFILILTLCFLIFLYYMAHRFFHYRSLEAIFKKFHPGHNMAEGLYFFSRIIGIGIIFSSNYLSLEDGPFNGIVLLAMHSILQLILYSVSIYIIQSVVLYNFEYNDEILRRKNLSYSTICFFMALGLALLLKKMILLSHQSIQILIFMWSFSTVLFGVSAKLFRYISYFPVNQMVLQKNMALAYSFSGHLLSTTIIIESAFDHDFVDVESFSLQMALKILLSLIILPLFYKGLIWSFHIHHDRSLLLGARDTEQEDEGLHETPAAYGLFEGILLATAALLTSVATGHILFSEVVTWLE